MTDGRFRPTVDERLAAPAFPLAPGRTASLTFVKQSGRRVEDEVAVMTAYRHAATAGILAALGVLVARWAMDGDTPRSPSHISNLLAAAAAIPGHLPFVHHKAPEARIAGYIRLSEPPVTESAPRFVIAALPPQPAPRRRRARRLSSTRESTRRRSARSKSARARRRPGRRRPRTGAPVLAAPAHIVPPELQRFAAAAALYRKNGYAGGDALAAQIADPLQRAGLEWIALKTSPSPDHDRLLAFETAHEDWPLASWIHEVREGWLYNKHAPAAYVAAMFADKSPRTPAGVVALARAKIEQGQPAEANELVRKLWRESDMDAHAEAAVLKEFSGVLTRADHKYRADRLLYAERVGAGMRAAALAGPRRRRARQCALRRRCTGRCPRPRSPGLRRCKSDPGLLFARVAGRAARQSPG